MTRPRPATLVGPSAVREASAPLAVALAIDDPALRAVVQTALAPLDCQLRTVATDQVASVAAEVGLAIFALPAGLDPASALRRCEVGAPRPILFVATDSPDPAALRRALALGASDVAFGPALVEALRARLALHLELHARGQEVTRLTTQLAAAEALEQVEAELLRTNRRLAAADQRKDEFIAILGHELRNPLAPMVNGLELLRDVSTTDPALARAHAALERQVEHVRRLVDDLLDLSRIDSGKIELRREPVELAALVAEAAAMTRGAFAARGQVLEIDLPGPSLVLDADPTRLAQVLCNLLSNASRYSPDGTVTRIVGRVERDALVIEVTDRGRGIAPELLARLFDGFVQARSGCGGLGIGLAVSRRLVERHGGRLSARSPGEDQGSTFELRMPVRHQADDATLRTEAPPVAAAAPQGSLSVVLVEDSDDIRETTQALLERAGHTVAAAADGPTGAALIIQLRPDVALVDLGLPGCDGLEVARRVRATLGDAVRLVAMTGFGQSSDRQRALAAGFDAHLAKPARVGQLHAALRPPG